MINQWDVSCKLAERGTYVGEGEQRSKIFNLHSNKNGGLHSSHSLSYLLAAPIS